MSARVVAVVDAGGFSRLSSDQSHPLWWGFLGMIAIETTVFASLVAAYFYLQTTAESWPPEPLRSPALVLPTINTLILVASSGAMRWADRSVKRGEARRLALGLTVGIVLALAFLALKAYEYGAHVTALVLKTIVVATLAWRGYFDRERRLAVTVNGLYWHFVVLIWIPLYVVLYWSPRVL